jgi:phosphoenolpyruvate-protein kinase (PTS system EI component)
MGLSEFSMHHTSLSEVKSVIHSSSIKALKPLVQELLDNTRTGQIQERIDSLNQNIF